MSQTPEHDLTDADESADRAIAPEPAGFAADAPPADAASVPGPTHEPEPSASPADHSQSESPAEPEPLPESEPEAEPEPRPEPTAVLPKPEPTAALPAPGPTAALPSAPPAHQPYQGPGQGQHQAQPPYRAPQPPPYPGQPPYLAPPAPPQYPGQQPGYFGAPGGAPGPAPNWATPTAPGLPPYGAPGGPGDPDQPEAKPKKPAGSRIVLVAAVIAAVVGAAVGAGVTYALKNNSSSTSLGSANNNSATSSLNSGSANATAVTTVASKIVPSVVTITVAASDGSGDSGTGIIISSTGQILTNNHVIAAAQGSGDSLTVTFNSGKITTATILGADPSSDLAVIQAAGVTGLTPATLGDSSTVAVGEQVVAIGEPLGLTNTVTSGIVSALNRPVAPESDDPDATTTSTAVLDAIQTDAPINPGNSGGPLINLQGQVIGIDSAIASDSSSGGDGSSQAGSIGLGFAIPINQAKPIAQELIKTGKATHSLLGVSVQDPGTSATHTGAGVTAVTANGPASGTGIKVGDVITAVDNQQIADAESLVAAVRSYQPGTTITLTYIRGGQTLTAKVTLTTAAATTG